MEELADCIGTLTHNTKIYKDQCVQCFNTPLHAPLYVDFRNYWGYCADHASKQGNSVYLKHIREVKEKPAQDEPGPPATKITRLAIGVEGGFDADKDQFEYEDKYSIHVHLADGSTQDIELGCANLPDIMKQTADKVIALSSAGQQEDSKQWEGDIRRNSKHSDRLLQLDNGVKVPPGPWKCSIASCDKTDNLWMNLTCGSIFCGRRYYDGTGGNNHAPDYYEHMQYPLAVKLGTITPQGGDVYSYDEDDMVIDTQLAKHLKHFGIDMMECKQTDKTMNELEIAANMNLKLEYDNILEAGVALKPVFGSGYLGYINMGNTCYMNSVLQVLVNCVSKLANRYLTYDNPACQVPVDFAKQFSTLIHYTQKPGRYSLDPEDVKPGHENGIRPKLLKSIIGKDHAEFSSTRQQDAHEYYLHLVSLLEKEERKTPALQCTDELCYEVEERIQCNTSQQVLYKTRKEHCLSLAIPLDRARNVAAAQEWERKRAVLEETGEKIKPEDCIKYRVDLADCLKNLSIPEVIADFKSSATNDKTTANKTTGFKTFPNFLMLQMRRFTLTANWQPKKLDVLLDVPELLDIEYLRSSGLKAGEVELPSGPAEPAPLEPDPVIVEGLMNMGFGFESCRKAAYHTKNAGVEAAMEWVFAHMDDPDLNSPLVIEQAPKSGGAAADPESIEMLCAMGFTDKQAAKALQKCDNNLERAADWIFSHADELDQEEPGSEAAAALPDGGGKYRLRAFISHMGTSTACGHYVCHIKDREGRWVLYNDEKVAVSVTPPKDMAYMYLYERLE